MGEINHPALRGGTPEKPDTEQAIVLDKEFGPKTRATIKKFAGAYYSGALKDLGQYNPYKITYEQMYMMRVDPIIKMGLYYTIAPLANAPWRCEGSDPQQVAFAEEALKRIYISLIRAYFTKLDFGHSAILKRFKREIPNWTYMDPETREEIPVWPEEDIQAVIWSAPRALPPEVCNPAFTNDGEHFDGIEWEKKPGLRDKDENISSSGDPNKKEIIPVGHALWAVNEKEESFNNWAGYPRTGYAFRYWWSYWFRYILADRHFEQDADPPMKVTYPPGVTETEDGEQQNADIALGIGEQARAGSTIAMPSSVYSDDLGKPTGQKMWDAEFMRDGENMETYHASFDDLRVMKLRAMLVPEQALIEGKGGTSSRNVAASFGKIFSESLGILMEEFDRDVNEYMIPDLLAINFVEPVTVTKVTTGFRQVDIEVGARLLEYIANRGTDELPIDVPQLLDEIGIPRLKVTISKLPEDEEESEVPPPNPEEEEVPPAEESQTATPPSSEES